MIDIKQFGHHWGKVQHQLDRVWTWDEVLLLMQTQTASNPQYLRDLGNSGFTVGGLASNDYCKAVLDYVHPLAPDYYARAGLYVSLDSNSNSFPPHSDQGQHVWIWQILGNTPWFVAGSEFVLEQGELLYITPGTEHAARPNQPRASISFSLEKFD